MTIAESKPAKVLTTEERAQFEQCESRIARGISTFKDVGEALTIIITGKLYKEHYATSDAYLAEKWGMTRQHANRLISAAHTASVLEPIGLQPENERQARDWKKAAAIYEKASPAAQLAFARVVQKTTRTQEPSTAQINAFSGVIEQIDAAGVVEDPETGEHLRVEDLTPERLDAILQENVTTATYESIKRKESHIQEKILESNQTGRGGWTDWMMTKGKELTEHQELQLIVRPDASGNPVAFVRIVDTKTGHALACGETASYLKKAVLLFVEENGK